ncbi:hypothetical protein CL673_00145, partial [Candidatus Bathyarchaeota archaeon]|nr:hypothetical protein [Candidatus Bathyarchaeota archaeon]
MQQGELLEDQQKEIDEGLRLTMGESAEAKEWARRGAEHHQNERWREVRMCFTQAIKKAPQSTVYRVNRGIANVSLGRYRKALRDFTFVTERDRGFETAWIRKARCHWVLEEYTQAVVAMHQGLVESRDPEIATSGLMDALGRLRDFEVNSIGNPPRQKNALRAAWRSREVRGIVAKADISAALATHTRNSTTVRNPIVFNPVVPINTDSESEADSDDGERETVNAPSSTPGASSSSTQGISTGNTALLPNPTRLNINNARTQTSNTVGETPAPATSSAASPAATETGLVSPMQYRILGISPTPPPERPEPRTFPEDLDPGFDHWHPFRAQYCPIQPDGSLPEILLDSKRTPNDIWLPDIRNVDVIGRKIKQPLRFGRTRKPRWVDESRRFPRGPCSWYPAIRLTNGPPSIPQVFFRPSAAVEKYLSIPFSLTYHWQNREWEIMEERTGLVIMRSTSGDPATAAINFFNRGPKRVKNKRGQMIFRNPPPIPVDKVTFPEWRGAALRRVSANLLQQSPEERLGRQLSALLRHHQTDYDDIIQYQGGWVSLEQLHGRLDRRIEDDFTITWNVLEMIAESDSKQRFVNGTFVIRANQGHSARFTIQGRKGIPVDLSSVAIRVDSDNPQHRTAKHGTFAANWDSIVATGGLSRMDRTHINFALGDPEWNEVSGMRAGVNLIFELDVLRAVDEQFQLLLPHNATLIARGNSHGILPLRLFSAVKWLHRNKERVIMKYGVFTPENIEMQTYISNHKHRPGPIIHRRRGTTPGDTNTPVILEESANAGTVQPNTVSSNVESDPQTQNNSDISASGTMVPTSNVSNIAISALAETSNTPAPSTSSNQRVRSRGRSRNRDRETRGTGPKCDPRNIRSRHNHPKTIACSGVAIPLTNGDGPSVTPVQMTAGGDATSVVPGTSVLSEGNRVTAAMEVEPQSEGFRKSSRDSEPIETRSGKRSKLNDGTAADVPGKDAAEFCSPVASTHAGDNSGFLSPEEGAAVPTPSQGSTQRDNLVGTNRKKALWFIFTTETTIRKPIAFAALTPTEPQVLREYPGGECRDEETRLEMIERYMNENYKLEKDTPAGRVLAKVIQQSTYLGETIDCDGTRIQASAYEATKEEEKLISEQWTPVVGKLQKARFADNWIHESTLSTHWRDVLTWTIGKYYREHRTEEEWHRVSGRDGDPNIEGPNNNQEVHQDRNSKRTARQPEIVNLSSEEDDSFEEANESIEGEDSESDIEDPNAPGKDVMLAWSKADQLTRRFVHDMAKSCVGYIKTEGENTTRWEENCRKGCNFTKEERAEIALCVGHGADWNDELINCEGGGYRSGVVGLPNSKKDKHYKRYPVFRMELLKQYGEDIRGLLRGVVLKSDLQETYFRPQGPIDKTESQSRAHFTHGCPLWALTNIILQGQVQKGGMGGYFDRPDKSRLGLYVSPGEIEEGGYSAGLFAVDDSNFVSLIHAHLIFSADVHEEEGYPVATRNIGRSNKGGQTGERFFRKECRIEELGIRFNPICHLPKLMEWKGMVPLYKKTHGEAWVRSSHYKWVAGLCDFPSNSVFTKEGSSLNDEDDSSDDDKDSSDKGGDSSEEGEDSSDDGGGNDTPRSSDNIPRSRWGVTQDELNGFERNFGPERLEVESHDHEIDKSIAALKIFCGPNHYEPTVASYCTLDLGKRDHGRASRMLTQPRPDRIGSLVPQVHYTLHDDPEKRKQHETRMKQMREANFRIPIGKVDPLEFVTKKLKDQVITPVLDEDAWAESQVEREGRQTNAQRIFQQYDTFEGITSRVEPTDKMVYATAGAISALMKGTYLKHACEIVVGRHQGRPCLYQRKLEDIPDENRVAVYSTFVMKDLLFGVKGRRCQATILHVLTIGEYRVAVLAPVDAFHRPVLSTKKKGNTKESQPDVLHFKSVADPGGHGYKVTDNKVLDHYCSFRASGANALYISCRSAQGVVTSIEHWEFSSLRAILNQKHVLRKAEEIELHTELVLSDICKYASKNPGNTFLIKTVEQSALHVQIPGNPPRSALWGRPLRYWMHIIASTELCPANCYQEVAQQIGRPRDQRQDAIPSIQYILEDNRRANQENNMVHQILTQEEIAEQVEIAVEDQAIAEMEYNKMNQRWDLEDLQLMWTEKRFPAISYKERQNDSVKAMIAAQDVSREMCTKVLAGNTEVISRPGEVYKTITDAATSHLERKVIAEFYLREIDYAIDDNSRTRLLLCLSDIMYYETNLQAHQRPPWAKSIVKAVFDALRGKLNRLVKHAASTKYSFGLYIKTGREAVWKALLKGTVATCVGFYWMSSYLKRTVLDLIAIRGHVAMYYALLIITEVGYTWKEFNRQFYLQVFGEATAITATLGRRISQVDRGAVSRHVDPPGVRLRIELLNQRTAMEKWRDYQIQIRQDRISMHDWHKQGLSMVDNQTFLQYARQDALSQYVNQNTRRNTETSTGPTVVVAPTATGESMLHTVINRMYVFRLNPLGPLRHITVKVTDQPTWMRKTRIYRWIERTWQLTTTYSKEADIDKDLRELLHMWGKLKTASPLEGLKERRKKRMRCFSRAMLVCLTGYGPSLGVPDELLHAIHCIIQYIVILGQMTRPILTDPKHTMHCHSHHRPYKGSDPMNSQNGEDIRRNTNDIQPAQHIGTAVDRGNVPWLYAFLYLIEIEMGPEINTSVDLNQIGNYVECHMALMSLATDGLFKKDAKGKIIDRSVPPTDWNDNYRCLVRAEPLTKYFKGVPTKDQHRQQRFVEESMAKRRVLNDNLRYPTPERRSAWEADVMNNSYYVKADLEQKEHPTVPGYWEALVYWQNSEEWPYSLFSQLVTQVTKISWRSFYHFENRSQRPDTENLQGLTAAQNRFLQEHQYGTFATHIADSVERNEQLNLDDIYAWDNQAEKFFLKADDPNNDRAEDSPPPPPRNPPGPGGPSDRSTRNQGNPSASSNSSSSSSGGGARSSGGTMNTGKRPRKRSSTVFFEGITLGHDSPEETKKRKVERLSNDVDQRAQAAQKSQTNAKRNTLSDTSGTLRINEEVNITDDVRAERAKAHLATSSIITQGETENHGAYIPLEPVNRF